MTSDTPKTPRVPKQSVHPKAGQKVGPTGKVVPLSERERLFKNWSKAECAEYLRDIQSQHPDLFISRNWFRANSEISDSTWNRHFGTFQEYKRSSGIDLSRAASRLEKHIARHAGSDVIAAFSVDRAEYTGKYARPDTSTRWKTLVAISDVHDKHMDPFWRRVVLEAIRRIQPEVVCINGDLFDLPEFGKYAIDPREWDVTGRIRVAHALLRDIREAAPDAQLDLIEGNHEFRLFRHLSEATPALRAVLSDLHGFTIPKLLGLDEYQVNFTGSADLKAWSEKDIKKELNRNWKTYWDAVLACHYPERRALRIPGFGGHHHKHEVWPFQSPIYGAAEFHQMGAGHIRAAEYCDGEKWQMGFLVAHVDNLTKTTCFEYVPVQDHAVVGGTWYLRQPDEVVV